MAKAIVVGGCIGGGDGISDSLRSYEGRLVGRTIQLENPLLRGLRDAIAKRTSARAQLRQYEEIARYQA